MGQCGVSRYRKTDADYVKKKGTRLETYLNGTVQNSSCLPLTRAAGLLAIADVANSPELYNFFFKVWLLLLMLLLTHSGQARFAIGMRASFSGMV